MASPIQDAVLLSLINLGFSIADLAAKRAAGQTVTAEALADLRAQTAKVMDEAHAQVAKDEANG